MLSLSTFVLVQGKRPVVDALKSLPPGLVERGEKFPHEDALESESKILYHAMNVGISSTALQLKHLQLFNEYD